MLNSAEHLAATRGSLRFRGTPVEKHWSTLFRCSLEIILKRQLII